MACSLKRIASLGSALALGLAAVSPASAVDLTTGIDDGDVSVGVSAAGAFGGSAGADGASTAFYNPVGATESASTTFQSYVYLRFGDTGTRLNISTLPGTILSSSSTSVTSTFSTGGLDFTLVQTLSELFGTGGTQTGSLLTQAYSFVNTTADDLTLEFVRYLDGDLQFDGDLTDGGGRLILNGREVLFETDTAVGSADSNTFVGIYNDGGTAAGYEVDGFSGLLSRIQAGDPLDNTVTGDGADADQFIDSGSGYDVTLALRRTYTIGAGGTGSFLTGTIFGSGAADDVVIPSGVPEPATWAMMLVGFGAIGAAMRRQRQKVRYTFA